MSSCQALWRFLSNDRVGLVDLIAPLREMAREAVADQQGGFVLLVHDWSKLSYQRHSSKLDQVRVGSQKDIGYELTVALLVDAQRGCPLAPMELELFAADGTHTTRQAGIAPRQGHLPQVLATMNASRNWGLAPQIVHVIDREADSLADWRDWHSGGHLFLVRADESRIVEWRGTTTSFSFIARSLQKEEAFCCTRDVEYQGKPAKLFVAKSAITICKPGRRRIGKTKRVLVPGPPLVLRLIVAQVRDEDEKTLATWFLVTNLLDDHLSADRLALWYYWRWRIESYFKLMKSAGQELEHWQQESAEHIAKRLLIASAACVAMWQLEREKTPIAEEYRHVLVRLSGRQTKRKKPVTTSALLAGFERLLAVLDVLHDYTPEQLTRIVRSIIPHPPPRRGATMCRY